MVTSNIIEAVVSIKRLSSFLDSDELQEDARVLRLPPGERLQKGDEVLRIKGGEFRWSKKEPTPTLEDINLTVKKGELVSVLGRVGAGKVSRRVYFGEALTVLIRY
jgi:ABC-type bacteriocin/lantibiotic exporter with double-glycine peptidase domain